MIRIIVVSAVALILGSKANAATPEQFQGHWSGRGTYILDGKMTSCSDFVLDFAGTEATMTFVGGGRTCESHQEEFGRVEMAFRDGGLYFAGKKVGTLEGNLLSVAFRAPEGDGRFRNWRMSMRREGNHMVYEESRTYDESATPFISFAGLLTLSNDAK